jgi:hypothetical protein
LSWLTPAPAAIAARINSFSLIIGHFHIISPLRWLHIFAIFIIFAIAIAYAKEFFMMFSPDYFHITPFRHQIFLSMFHFAR